MSNNKELRSHVNEIQSELSKFVDNLELKVDESLDKIERISYKERLDLFDALATTMRSNLIGGENSG